MKAKNNAILRIMSAAIALILVILPISSCAESSNDPADDTKSVVSESITSDTEAVTTANPLDAIPDVNLNGITIKVLTRGSSWWQHTDIGAETITGEIINDSLFNRNSELESRLNIKYEYDQSITESGAVTTTIRNLVMANDSEYDIAIPQMNGGATLAAEDLLINLYNIDTLDLTNPAWDQNANNYFEIENKLYFGVSDISLGKNETLWVCMFNKRLVDDYKIEDPYQLVRDGKWTFDKTYEIITQATSDLNGDGVMKATDDMFGLATHETNFYALLIGGGEAIVSKDSEGKLVLNAGNERFLNVYDKISQLFSKQDHTVIEYEGETFMAGRALLCAQVLGCVRLFREMEDDFGLLPVPKYDEAQSNYYAYAIPYEVYASVIPASVKDPEVSGTVLQALAILSSYYTTPAYYDVTITGKGLRDEQSAEMLDIITGGIIYDLARMFDWGSVASGITTALVNKQEFSSFYARRQKAVARTMEETVEAFAANKN